ncbi:unnamed protein product [Didymodactylos carnosus]|uniref:C2 domain-containing protein n=1 Tax=Didymodactylos carnosus TaxID=1234261 RepID=A0A814REI4_9BILA|nr:unnamed protein product [Didymodactylos carnosus]CAF1132870.1 unnamed protein product [Didymodactylos carnosus]CAF3820717.1 unnamed protein product [Didymodactylos carnosus]CAF3896673.1 unnamed protein product [Didymodactylos carnosus]
MSAGQLSVTVVQAEGLHDKDTIGKNDAYVELYLDKDYKQRTSTKNNSNSPTWNETFILYVNSFRKIKKLMYSRILIFSNVQAGQHTLHLHVYDDDIGDRDSIGSVKIDLRPIMEGAAFDQWVKLPAHFGLGSHGKVRVIMTFTVIWNDSL